MSERTHTDLRCSFLAGECTAPWRSGPPFRAAGMLTISRHVRSGGGILGTVSLSLSLFSFCASWCLYVYM